MACVAGAVSAFQQFNQGALATASSSVGASIALDFNFIELVVAGIILFGRRFLAMDLGHLFLEYLGSALIEATVNTRFEFAD